MSIKIQLLESLFENVIGQDPSCKVKLRSEILNWDSLRHAELMIAIEKQFKLRLSTAELLSIDSFSALKKIIIKSPP